MRKGSVNGGNEWLKEQWGKTDKQTVESSEARKGEGELITRNIIFPYFVRIDSLMLSSYRWIYLICFGSVGLRKLETYFQQMKAEILSRLWKIFIFHHMFWCLSTIFHREMKMLINMTLSVELINFSLFVSAETRNTSLREVQNVI